MEQIKHLASVVSEVEGQVDFLADLLTTHNLLHSDAIQMALLWKAAGDEGDEPKFWLLTRATLRAQMTYFEFVTRMFLEIVFFFEDRASKLTDAEQQKASLFLADDKEGRLRLTEAFKFSIRCVEKAYGFSERTDFGTGGWDLFKETTARRNRLTHPKRSADLIFTGEEALNLIAGAGWAVQAVLSLMEKIASSEGGSGTSQPPDFEGAKEKIRNIAKMVEKVNSGEMSPFALLELLQATKS